MALRTQLSPDDDIGFTCRNFLDPRLELSRRPEQIRGQNRNAGVRKKRFDFFTHSLNARANRGQAILGLAMGTLCRERLCLSALMAHQSLQETVFNHPRVAVIASDLIAAGPA